MFNWAWQGVEIFYVKVRWFHFVFLFFPLVSLLFSIDGCWFFFLLIASGAYMKMMIEQSTRASFKNANFVINHSPWSFHVSSFQILYCIAEDLKPSIKFCQLIIDFQSFIWRWTRNVDDSLIQNYFLFLRSASLVTSIWITILGNLDDYTKGY